MSKVFLDMAMSLDGFISGPDGQDHGLHDWYFDPSPQSQAVIDELTSGIGAMVLGSRAYGAAAAHAPHADDPYQMPHFVLTHTPPAPETVLDPRVTFVTDGLERCLERARAAAGDRDICIAGGANVAQQFLAAGLIDELRIHLVPVVFGAGVRLFELFASGPIRLERRRVIEARGVTHLRFDVLR